MKMSVHNICDESLVQAKATKEIKNAFSLRFTILVFRTNERTIFSPFLLQQYVVTY
jgi:hypothetical protein